MHACTRSSGWSFTYTPYAVSFVAAVAFTAVRSRYFAIAFGVYASSTTYRAHPWTSRRAALSPPGPYRYYVMYYSGLQQISISCIQVILEFLYNTIYTYT